MHIYTIAKECSCNTNAPKVIGISHVNWMKYYFSLNHHAILALWPLVYNSLPDYRAWNSVAVLEQMKHDAGGIDLATGNMQICVTMHSV